MSTKATSSVIQDIALSQIQAGLATNGQILTFNNTTSAWVASAAPAGTDNFNELFNATGYVDFPGGLIMQWSSGIPFATSVTVAFPKAFPTACLQVIASTTGTVAAGSIIGVASFNKNGVTLSSRSDASWGYTYIAVGY